MSDALQSGRVILQGECMISRTNFPWVFNTVWHDFLENDFFKDQPIEGASVYYLRMILHDWADSYCLQILKQLREAAAPTSILLICESILSYPCEDTTGAQDIPGGTEPVPLRPLLPNWGYANLFLQLMNNQVSISYIVDLGQSLTPAISCLDDGPHEWDGTHIGPIWSFVFPDRVENCQGISQ